VGELLGHGGSVVAAVDAPLLRRPGCMAERELARAFGRYHAAAYNANMDFLERKGLLAGPRLGEALLSARFSLDPLALTACAEGRFAFEMYPHAFHVAAFGLERRLGYKKGRIAGRKAELAVYQEQLRAMVGRLAPGLADDERVVDVLASSALTATGRALKALEDRLDALTCALAALIAWRDGISAGDVFGDAESGYIAVPGLLRDPRFVARTNLP
jgi:predicted RNase H-like nuclease